MSSKAGFQLFKEIAFISPFADRHKKMMGLACEHKTLTQDGVLKSNKVLRVDVNSLKFKMQMHAARDSDTLARLKYRHRKLIRVL